MAPTGPGAALSALSVGGGSEARDRQKGPIHGIVESLPWRCLQPQSQGKEPLGKPRDLGVMALFLWSYALRGRCRW